MNKQEHEALRLCVASLDQLLPYLAKVPADVGLLNDALMAARPLLKVEPIELAPAQDEREIIGVERYRVVRYSGNFGIACVKAGDGERKLFQGLINDCERVAAELATAFEDGKFVATRPAQTGQQHPDDAAVDRFAAAMKAKLAAARAKGRGGWDDPNVCSVEFLAQLLVEHLAKGNAGTFEDVANFAMMLHQRGAEPKVLADAAPIAQTAPQSDCEWCAGAGHDPYGDKCQHCKTAQGDRA